ncbi:MAG: 2-oxo acid dehydrogenase subunit E2 [Candidatus Spechtbacteria bacterium]|nr:2-oxo acid dehydrogenase subunit E2 [Candidatus Spechtbacteria bacterium]
MRHPIRVSTEDTGGSYPGTLEMSVIQWLRKQGETIKIGDDLVVIQTEKAEVTLKAKILGVLVEIIYTDGGEFQVTSDLQEQSGGITFYRTVLGYIEDEPVLSIGRSILSNSASIEPEETIDMPYKITPLAWQMMRARNIDPAAVYKIVGVDSTGRIGKEQVEAYERHVTDTQQLVREVSSAILATQNVESKMSVVPSNVAIKASPFDNKELRASPAARALARERGIDLDAAGIAGTGPDGIILPADVEKFLVFDKQILPTPTTPAPSTTPAVSNGAETKIIPLSPVQQAIARNLEEGWKKPTGQDEKDHDVSILTSFRQWYGQKFEKRVGVKLQLAFPFVAALVRVLARDEFAAFLNGYIDTDEKGKLVFVRSMNINLGIAFNTPRDELVILTVRQANTLSLVDLARATATLQRKSQDRTFTLMEQKGFTFIFNNIGGLKTLIPPARRSKVRQRSGYSLLTKDVSLQVDLGEIDRDGWATIPITFDHRAVGGGFITRFIDTVFGELDEHIIPELQELCGKC